jgi:hypothetical protein
MPGHQCGKCRLARGIAARDEPIDKLAVGEPHDRAAIKERPNLSDDGAGCQVRHVRRHSRRNRVASYPLADTALTSNILSRVVNRTEIFFAIAGYSFDAGRLGCSENKVAS